MLFQSHLQVVMLCTSAQVREGLIDTCRQALNLM